MGGTLVFSLAGWITYTHAYPYACPCAYAYAYAGGWYARLLVSGVDHQCKHVSVHPASYRDDAPQTSRGRCTHTCTWCSHVCVCAQPCSNARACTHTNTMHRFHQAVHVQMGASSYSLTYSPCSLTYLRFHQAAHVQMGAASAVRVRRADGGCEYKPPTPSRPRGLPYGGGTGCRARGTWYS